MFRLLSLRLLLPSFVFFLPRTRLVETCWFWSWSTLFQEFRKKISRVGANVGSILGTHVGDRHQEKMRSHVAATRNKKNNARNQESTRIFATEQFGDKTINPCFDDHGSVRNRPICRISARVLVLMSSDCTSTIDLINQLKSILTKELHHWRTGLIVISYKANLTSITGEFK